MELIINEYDLKRLIILLGPRSPGQLDKIRARVYKIARQSRPVRECPLVRIGRHVKWAFWDVNLSDPAIRRE